MTGVEWNYDSTDPCVKIKKIFYGNDEEIELVWGVTLTLCRNDLNLMLNGVTSKSAGMNFSDGDINHIITYSVGLPYLKRVKLNGSIYNAMMETAPFAAPEEWFDLCDNCESKDQQAIKASYNKLNNRLRELHLNTLPEKVVETIQRDYC